MQNMDRLDMASCSLQHLTWHECDELSRGQCPLRCQSRSSHPAWWHDVDTFDRLRHYGMHKYSSKTSGSLGVSALAFCLWKLDCRWFDNEGNSTTGFMLEGALLLVLVLWTLTIGTSGIAAVSERNSSFVPLASHVLAVWCVVMFCVCTFSVSPPLVLKSLHLSPSFASTTLL